jgi:hypothetical protein
MEIVEKKCFVCGSKPTKRLYDGNNNGFFYVCDSEECKKSIENMVTNIEK